MPDPADHARARNSDPWTSHAAARSIPFDKLRESQRAVFDCFVHFGQMHHDDLVEHYEHYRYLYRWPMQSISGLRTRTSELVEAGYLRNSGKVVVLKSNRKSIVWEVATNEPTETAGVIARPAPRPLEPLQEQLTL